MLALAAERAAIATARACSSWDAAGARSRCAWPRASRTRALCGVELAVAARVHHRAGRRARLANVEIVTADIALSRPIGASIASSRWRCSSTCATTAAARAHCRAGCIPTGGCSCTSFAHRTFAYPFEAREASDWMARHFFTGGMMPSDALFLRLPGRPRPSSTGGGSPARTTPRTAEAWLQNMDRHRTRSWRSSRGRTATRRSRGGTDGAPSSWRARNCFAYATAKSGECHIIYSRRVTSEVQEQITVQTEVQTFTRQ